MRDIQTLLAKIESWRAQHATGAPPSPPTCERCEGSKWIRVHGNRVARCPDCFFGVDDPFAPSLPTEFRKAILSNYSQLPGNAAAIKHATKWLDAELAGEEHGDLFLFGGVGSGKTRLGASLLNELYRQRRQVLFTRVSGMLFSLQPGRSDEDREKFWKQLTTVPVLMLDDIGAERDEATDYTLRTVLDLYEERWNAGRRTIWTSNKSLGELSEQMRDERIPSRIAGRATVVHIQSSDQRVKS